MTEAFKQLRANIIFSAGDNRGSTVGITSAQSGEGKSLLSANLAYSLSIMGKRVLLVECDMRCPTFSKLFKTKCEKGLSELLARDLDAAGTHNVSRYIMKMSAKPRGGTTV